MDQDKSDIEVKIALTTCQHLEQSYREAVLNGIDQRRREKVFEAFEQ